MEMIEREKIDLDNWLDSQNCMVLCHSYYGEHVFGKKHLVQYKKLCDPSDGHEPKKIFVDYINDCEDHYHYCLGNCHSECACQERT